jgi:hypothetical protein
MTSCKSCGKDLTAHRAAHINGIAQGDHVGESWFLCPDCDMYTLRLFHEAFTSGAESTSAHGPYARAHGDAKVAIIAGCPDPLDDWCDCAAHVKYFS